MANVELLKAIGGNEKGAKINVGQGAANYLITNGYATEVRTEPKAEPVAESKPKRKRGGGDSPAEEPTTAG